MGLIHKELLTEELFAIVKQPEVVLPSKPCTTRLNVYSNVHVRFKYDVEPFCSFNEKHLNQLAQVVPDKCCVFPQMNSLRHFETLQETHRDVCSGAGPKYRGGDEPDDVGVPALLGQDPEQAAGADEQPQGPHLHRPLRPHAHGLPPHL